MYDNPLIFGKNTLQGIVSLEAHDGSTEIFTQAEDGTISSSFVPNRYWVLSNQKLTTKASRLEGESHYKWGHQFVKREEFLNFRKEFRSADIYSIYNPKEAFMVNFGYTYYKGLTPQDVSILSFDIETLGLNHVLDNKLLIISNTYRCKDKTIKKIFTYDDFKDEGEMLQAWCAWVREINPSVLLGHNIYSFDIPFLQYIADRSGVSLTLGRDNSPLQLDNWTSSFRIDGSREQDYRKVKCYGREICDTYFLAIKYDSARELESYGLKPIIKQLNLEDPNRQHYDAGAIRVNYTIKEEWEKIKKYAIDDADDPIKLWDLMIPPYFYSSNNIPKPFSEVLLSATGSQINSILVRGYLQDKHSVPKADNLENVHVEGGVSFGVPGIYKNVIKIDLKSAYPSQILRFKLYDKYKDPKAYFYEMVKYFTEMRFEYKRLGKETGEKKWKDLDAVNKIFINSAYGALNTSGLNFNNSTLAAKITEETRNVIDLALNWASGKGKDFWMGKYGNKKEGDEDV